MSSSNPAVPAPASATDTMLAALAGLAGVVGQQILTSPQFQQAIAGMLMSAFQNAFQPKPKPAQTVVVPADTPIQPQPGVVTPIPKPSASTPAEGEIARVVARVKLQVQKAVHAGEEPYTPQRLQECRNGDNYSRGSSLWLDQTALDQDGDEWLGHSIRAADKEFKTRHEIWKDGQLVAFIQGEGDDDANKPFDWKQQNGGGVHWAQRSWIDSVGMNARCTFSEDGNYTAVSYFDGVKANEVAINVG